jgi:hypothetical protein
MTHMRRISSRWTFFYKRVFPLTFFGFLLFIAATPFIGGTPTGRLPPFPFLIGPVFMAAFLYFIMKKLIFDLVDEVLEDGDELVVRNRHQEERIALSNIMNVSYSSLVNPPRVTLSLRQPSSSFGDQISFCPPLRFNPFSTNPIIDELIRRIDARRRA